MIELLGVAICILVALVIKLFCFSPEQIAKAAKAKAEAREKMRTNPALNTRDWELHAERFQRFGNSMYRDLHYFRGPRGGTYYINRNGHKTYC